jgi:transposase-like protein
VRDFLEGGRSVSAAARTFGVSRPTVRAVKDRTYSV